MTYTPAQRTLRAISVTAMIAVTGLLPQTALGRSGRPPLNTTGAPPQEITCSACHSGQGEGSLEVQFSGGDLVYVPNGVYDIRVILSEAGQTRFGFEMTSRIAEEPTSAIGTWTAGEFSTVFDEGRLIGHLDAPFSDDQHEFSMQWAAPSADIGDIKFYTAGVAANGDGSTEGDNTYALSFTLQPAANPTFWPDSPLYDGGWRYATEAYPELASIGWIWEQAWPWIFTYSMGDAGSGEWVWIAGGDANGFWGYNSAEDYWFWGDVVSGWYYSYDDANGGWQPYAL